MSVNLTGKYLDGAGLSKVWEKVKSYSSSNYLPLSGGNISGNLSTSGTLSVTGEATFTNNVTAKGFKVGNQIGFLKANGTIDDTNYLPLTGGTLTGPLTLTGIDGNGTITTEGVIAKNGLFVGRDIDNNVWDASVGLNYQIGYFTGQTEIASGLTEKDIFISIIPANGDEYGHIDITGPINMTGPVNMNGSLNAQSITLSSSITQDTQATTKKYVDDKVSSSISTAISELGSVLEFKGSINSTSVLPTSAELGWTYIVSEGGTYAGEVCEVGDMIICTTASTTAPTWTIIQRNIPGALSVNDIDSICAY